MSRYPQYKRDNKKEVVIITDLISINMEGVFEKRNLLLNELNRFSKDILYLGPAIEDDRVELF